MKRWQWLLILGGIAGLVSLIGFIPAGEARVGGGHSYGTPAESARPGNGDGIDADLIFFLIRLVFYYPQIGLPLLLLAVALYIWAARQNRDFRYSTRQITDIQYKPREKKIGLTQVMAIDENFSRVLFLDFCRQLYAKFHNLRGEHKLDFMRPYMDHDLISRFYPDKQLRDVLELVIGECSIQQIILPGPKRDWRFVVQFIANYTEKSEIKPPDPTEFITYYTEETWEFSRIKGILSKEPARLASISCPHCSGSLELQPDGRCRYCDQVVIPGRHDWAVTSITVVKKTPQRPRIIGQHVAEVGNDLTTIFQENYRFHYKTFIEKNPDFAPARFFERGRTIFQKLQQAWSDRKWELARPFLSDALFETHRYWMDLYRQEGLYNRIENVQIESMKMVRVEVDKFYNAITVRIFAAMIDYCENETQQLISGSRTRPRRCSEYWTFVQARGAQGSRHSDENCPNCGAPLTISMAGVCHYCQSKITTGNFDWIVAAIDQDESYQG
jgi:hypothetical protein